MIIPTVKETCVAILPIIEGFFLLGVAYIIYYGVQALFGSEVVATVATILAMGVVTPVVVCVGIKLDERWR